MRALENEWTLAKELHDEGTVLTLPRVVSFKVEKPVSFFKKSASDECLETNRSVFFASVFRASLFESRLLACYMTSCCSSHFAHKRRTRGDPDLHHLDAWYHTESARWRSFFLRTIKQPAWSIKRFFVREECICQVFEFESAASIEIFRFLGDERHIVRALNVYV